jgi:hypothetical protein
MLGHGSKLHEFKTLPVKPRSNLSKENRGAEKDSNQYGENSKDRGKENQAQPGNYKITQPFHGQPPRVELITAQISSISMSVIPGPEGKHKPEE